MKVFRLGQPARGLNKGEVAGGRGIAAAGLSIGRNTQCPWLRMDARASLLCAARCFPCSGLGTPSPQGLLHCIRAALSSSSRPRAPEEPQPRPPPPRGIPYHTNPHHRTPLRCAASSPSSRLFDREQRPSLTTHLPACLPAAPYLRLNRCLRPFRCPIFVFDSK